VEDIHLSREEDTGKSRGFAFVKYEDSRSCVLAVDNFVGAQVGFYCLNIQFVGFCDWIVSHLVCRFWEDHYGSIM
jgi:RNA recognition motif-containing protein